MKKKGFTLIELLAVVVLLTVLALVLIPVVTGIIDNARKSSLRTSVTGLVKASELYYHSYMNEESDFRLLEFDNNVQIDSYDKLDYKGSVNHGFIGIASESEIAVCIDNNKYYASKALNGDDIVVDEGTCTNEFDPDVYAFVTVGTANYTGLRLNVKQYTNVSNLPNKAAEGTVGVITDNKVTGYYVGKNAPSNPKEGTVWIILNNDSNFYIKTKTSEIGVAYVTQYVDGNWSLKEAYSYNDGWDQLTDFDNQIYEWDYSYSGEYETFTAPYSGYYTVELWGASGGDYSTTYMGGNGAYTKGDIYLSAGETIYVYVGQEGQKNSTGWNGGGKGFNNNGYGGGGATDVRLVPTSSNTAWYEIESLRTRIMVAAGGGGSSFYSSAVWGAGGGAGGGLISYVGTGGASSTTYEATAATQITAGLNSRANGNVGVDGSFGKGGDGYQASYHSGGGGGGWYGGGGGAHAGGNTSGGSSYISGQRGCVAVDSSLYVNGTNLSYTGKYFINTLMIDGEGYKWTNKKSYYSGMPNYTDGSTMVGNDGNGHAHISFKKFDAISPSDYANIGASLQNEWLYDYMGYYQVFTAPKAGTYKIELWGAQGGTHSTYIGGLGAYTSGEIYLSKDQVLYVYVGQEGQKNSTGWNGGGKGFNNSGYGGGGATDVRLVPTSSLTGWGEIDSLKSRIMVAGAGGGSSIYSSAAWGQSGGEAGGLVSYVGTGGASSTTYAATEATQTSGGTASRANGNVGTDGGFGYGGDGYQASYNSGGGGGGWYGGGGGSHAGGITSGGTSYISGHNGSIGMNEDTTMKENDSVSYTGYSFNNTSMIDGQGYKWTTSKGSQKKMPTYDGETLMIGNEGNGYAKITFIR
nr:prepilin-type N-terminal cleavage/methylation domain-containing protein [Bacilli bacterium]